VRIQLKDAPSHVRGVWILDARHGDPMADADFRRTFTELKSSLGHRSRRSAANRLAQSIPMRLAAHRAARPRPVSPAEYFQIRADALVLKTTPYSAILVELAWSVADD